MAYDLKQTKIKKEITENDTKISSLHIIDNPDTPKEFVLPEPEQHGI